MSMTLLIPILTLWWNMGSILSEFLEPELAAKSGTYLRILMLGAPAYSGFECVKKFLQAQRIMHASTWILLVSSLANLVFNYLLVSYPATAFGFEGAPAAQVLTLWCMFLSSIAYVRFVDGGAAWGGWSMEALTGWSDIIKLGKY